MEVITNRPAHGRRQVKLYACSPPANRDTKERINFPVLFSLEQEEIMSRLRIVLAMSLLGLVLAACSGAPLSGREKGALVGGGLGAGVGAIIGHQSGHAGAGAAIGGATGLLAGGLIGNESDKADARANEQDERMRRQDEELRRQRRELQQLKKQQQESEAAK